MSLLRRDDVIVALVDFQTILAPHMAGYEELKAAQLRLLKGASLLKLPVLACEQVPDKLGPTDPEVLASCNPVAVIKKHHFSAFAGEEYRGVLKAAGRRQVVVTGIEAHICVLQTAEELLAAGYEVFVPFDCVGSRDPDKKIFALGRLEKSGAVITNVESVLFEGLRDCRQPEFREISKLVR